MNKIQFTKMHGAGNDYIYVNVSDFPIADPSYASRHWSRRHKGIGSDGLVLIDKSNIPEADFSMRIFNSDGSEAMMCGNACRCIGKYLYERRLTSSTEIRLLTLSGIRLLRIEADGDKAKSVSVDMSEPLMSDSLQFIEHPGLEKGIFVSMGNPHYVIFTDDVDQVEYDGSILECHPSFPQRCNIEFAKILPDGSIRVRVWERGSGITMACGTGACATGVAASISGLSGRKSHIIMDGGELDVEWCETNNHVYLSGPAEFVYDGEIYL